MDRWVKRRDKIACYFKILNAVTIVFVEVDWELDAENGSEYDYTIDAIAQVIVECDGQASFKNKT